MAKTSRLLLQVKLAVFVLSNLRQHWQQRLCCRPLLQFTIPPCHVLVANVQMVVPLLAMQCPDSSELGTWIHDYVECASIVAECVARCKNMADCQHKCFCNATSPDCDSSQSVRQVDTSAQHYLVMPCRSAQSTKSTRSTSLPSTTCPIILGNRTSPCTVGCLCPSSCTVACC